MDIERGLSSEILGQTGRMDRSHPPLGSGVSMDELTGPQRVEAKAVDLAASSFNIDPSLKSNFQGPSVRARLEAVLSGATSLSNLTERVKKTFGMEAVQQLKSSVRTVFGNPSSCPFPAWETLMQWAGSKPVSQQVDGALTEALSTPAQVTRTQLKSAQSELGGVRHWTRTTKSGLPVGPGSYESGPRKLKRRNGRGRAGKNLSS